MDFGDVTSAKENGDKIFVHNDAIVIIDKLSYLFVIGSGYYHESLLASTGFS